jgi:hypothetical protein
LSFDSGAAPGAAPLITFLHARLPIVLRIAGTVSPDMILIVANLTLGRVGW